MITESIREFQKNASRHLSGDEMVIIEDAKSRTKRGVYIPYSLYRLFEKELNESIRKEMAESFTESFDGAGWAHES